MTELTEEDALLITRDKHGREIKVGDVLKVYHFTGARGKRYYMYKQVVGERLLGGFDGKPKVPYFYVSHLSMDEAENYTIHKHEGIMADCEILQGLDAIEDRPKYQQIKGP